ncbi:7-cyano-7-deazaguanine synthase [Candidatus Endomicrobiellum trichonymphae]|uniref:7-cyano-7-deazaguanine synthase n=1 Tax=Endomicrobium trichonymphae TaxID=1408204 RepID=UPI000BAA89FF|nr:7-cyano-7-deazaguanine synthase [Candidatus Endomicrobium trichonymphae]
MGVTSVDFLNYPDRPLEFIEAYNNVLKALKTKIIVQLSLWMKTRYKINKDTWTCYNDYKKLCMECDSCKLRIKCFKDAEINDTVLA